MVTQTDDVFASSRMPLGDHLDELSIRPGGALAGVAIIMFAGFTLDMIGMSSGVRNSASRSRFCVP